MKIFHYFIISAVFCSITVQTVFCADRIAIVFGNDAYEHAEPLANAVNDARSVATMLENTLGFTLIKPPKSSNLIGAGENIWKDVGIKSFYEGLEAFKREAATSKIGLIYYAGHGIEVDEVNYLLPVDAELAAASELRAQTIKVGEILADLKTTGLPAKLLILDCCRNNPLKTRSWARSRSTSKGLAPIADTELPEATMILLSAGPGQEALDGEDGNSPFTAALVKELPLPGRSAFDAFLKVSDTVTAVTGKRQEPWLKFDGGGRTFRAFQFVAGQVPKDAAAAKLAAMQAELEEVKRQTAATLAKSKTPAHPIGPTPDAAAKLAAMQAELEEVKRQTAAALAMTVSPNTGSFGTAPANSRGFTNSLGMIFLPVPGTDVLFCEHETRVMDYAAYAAANPSVNMEWKNVEYSGHKLALDHPVVKVSWEDARAFCAWLSAKEGKIYRLPTDHEWSIAVGIGGQENASASPEDKDGKISGYPWGSTWPPPNGAGNFHGSEGAGSWYKIEGYRDSHPFTAPVKSYNIGKHGLYDMSGNVWEWCEDLYSKSGTARVLRGGSWNVSAGMFLRSSDRFVEHPSVRNDGRGFRCVVSSAR